MSVGDVRKLVESVGESFGRDLDEWLACFADPFVTATDRRTVVSAHADARNHAATMLTELRERGFDRSGLRSIEVLMHGDDAAFASARFDRLRSDGTTIETIWGGYLCRKRQGRWVVVTLVPGNSIGG